jgi:flagellar capping protein FliD
MEDAMLSNFYLYSTLSSSPETLSYPLIAASTTVASQAAAQLSEQITNETAKVAAYDEMLAAVTGFQNTLAGFNFSDEASATAAAQDFVDGYNALASTIKELTGAGGVLKGDTTATLLVSSLQNKLSAAFPAAGSFDRLYQLGITPQTDGTLALDTDTFATAYAADAAGVDSLLTETASTFDALVDPYTTGGGIIESTAGVYGDNLLDLKMALPALESMGAQTQSYANAQYASAVYRLYSTSLTENLYASFAANSSMSFFA